jgi:hypothetical protein
VCARAQLLPKLLREWKPKQFPKSYLSNLVVAAHDMFKMAQSLANAGVKVLSTRRKSKKKAGAGVGEGASSRVCHSSLCPLSPPPPSHPTALWCALNSVVSSPSRRLGRGGRGR